VEDRESARARRLDLVAWWSEIFEVPCVALDVETAADAGQLARAGADFVAMRLPKVASPDALSRWSEDVARALSVPEAAA
jgi:thiamine-phosphate pyrophosphorylase